MNKKLKNNIIFCLTIIIIFSVYFFSTTEFIPGADSGEFIVLAKKGGIAHPPGYPLLILSLRLFNFLSPILGDLKSLIFSSIIFIVISAILLFKSLLKISNNYIAASITILSIFLSEIIWNITISIEPFSLNILQASIIIFLFVQSYYKSINPSLSLLFTCTIFSSGASNHHSLIFIFPLVLYILFETRKDLPLSKFLSIIIIGIIIGILPFLYFFIPKTEAQWVWGDWNNPIKRLLIHIFRREYGSFSLAAGEKGSPFTSIILYTKYLINSSTLISLTIAPLMLFDKKVKNFFNKNKLFCLILLSYFIFSGILFLLLFRLPLSNFSEYISRRFFALPTLFFIFPLFIFLNSMNKKYIYIVSFIFILTQIYINVINYTPNTFLKKHINNTYSICDSNSVLICKNDIDFITGLQIQYNIDNRKNIIPIFSGLLGLEWYFKRVEKKLKIDNKINNLNEFINYINIKRNVYFLDIPEKINSSIIKNAIPIGSLLKINKDSKLTISSILLLNQNLINGRIISLPSKGEIIMQDPWNAKILSYYSRSWHSIINNLDSTSQHSIEVSKKYLNLFSQ